MKEKWSRLTDDNLAEMQVKAFEETHEDYRPQTPA